MTDRIFKSHCYVVVRQDQHWPYLTCKESLMYAAELFNVADSENLELVVDEIIDKMGLRICADTRNARLSGGQARRLSIGMALLKQPTLIFMDEPTTGLDSAAAENIMQEIIRVAKDERLIIICSIHQVIPSAPLGCPVYQTTIHTAHFYFCLFVHSFRYQPSTKVFNDFDQLQILSKGREAFTGHVNAAAPYFEKIGRPVPPQTNPAEHYLDLVNADFSDEVEVDKILDTWEEERPDSGRSTHHHDKKGFGRPEDEDGQLGVVDTKRAPLYREISIMFRRSATLILRDPILYMGRCIVFLIANAIFALVYLNARKFDQDQALNKMWINVWHVGVASQMGVVAVYALNAEFATILREAKNGMVSPLTYVFAKTILVLPIMFIFAIFALGVPSFAIMDFPSESFGQAVLLWSVIMYVFECLAEALSVWFEDPIVGMLQYMNFWFGAFLFGGFLLAEDDIPWPFRCFYYFMPFSYYLRSQMYNLLIDTTWSECDPENNFQQSPVCVTPNTGEAVLGGIGLSYPLIEAKDTYWQDFGVMAAIAVFYKIIYVVGVYVKSARTAKVHPNEYNIPPTTNRAVLEAGEGTPAPSIKQPAFSTTNSASTVKQHTPEDDEFKVLVRGTRIFL